MISRFINEDWGDYSSVYRRRYISFSTQSAGVEFRPSDTAGTEYMVQEKVNSHDVVEYLTHSLSDSRCLSVSCMEHYEESEGNTRSRRSCVLLSLFNLRFSTPGTGRTSHHRVPDGQVRFLQSAPLDPTQFRGPSSLTHAIDRLSSGLNAELHVLKASPNRVTPPSFDGDEALFNLGGCTLKKPIQLVEV